MAMTEEDKELWASALESGKYPQGKGYLKQISAGGVVEYCCWGVICELKGLKQETVDSLVYFTMDGYTSDSYESELIPSGTWVDKLGVGEVRSRLLACMNDNEWEDISMDNIRAEYGLERRSYTFSEIAAFIRAHL